MNSSITIKVTHPTGLHARPASLFVHTANQFSSEIKVKNLTEDGEPSNAKSILGVLTLGVLQDHEIEIVASGEDSEEAIKALKELVECNFGEV